ncbi:hypothetical protein WICPIJ_002081 [Wickerhamomyces pijperi]|uniref:PRP1 splicing factor N-terminal domain-containing protein n=1 Tax=Wickerhamomyces pijperi TaxID=599730 RepID=A0A9P8QCE4_WICPI|nr:hypothetical protein WICPIJ_002081 [Wickerhamomyces pijperi]
MERKSFLDQQPPPGYIAGIGRGATGFTTRADVGSSRTPYTSRQGGTDSDDEDNFKDADDDDGGLLSLRASLDREDEEADEIFKQVEERMRSRNTKRRRMGLDEINNESEEQDAQDGNNVSKISAQFVDLKHGLSAISVEEWTNLPEVGDLTKRNKRLRKEEQDNRRTYAAPDSLLASNMANSSSAMASSIDITALTSDRQKVFKSQIDSAVEFGQGPADEGINSQTYLSQIQTPSTTDPEEIQKLRTVLTQYTKSDPYKAEGWIARARLEETAQNFTIARKIISQGCSNCPRDESVWLESVRMTEIVDLRMAKVIIADAVRKNGKSVKLWTRACELERDHNDKKRVIRKALEQLYSSGELWKLLIQLEEETEEKVKIANRATQLVSDDVDLWLILIDLQTYEEGKKSLNSARKANAHNVRIWLRAVQLEYEHSGDLDKVAKLVKKTFKECPDLSRDQWIEQAILYEDKGIPAITEAIINEIFRQQEEEEEGQGSSYAQLTTESSKYADHIHIYRSFLNQIVVKFPKKAAPWRNLISLYKAHFPLAELYGLFEKIITNFPKNATFRLMYSKEVWKSGNDITKAKEILNDSIKTLATNADIWLALIKLESLSPQSSSVVEELFQKAKVTVSNERIWYKYITYLRQQGDIPKALEVASEALSQYENCFKLHLQKSQLLAGLNQHQKAREVLSVATKLIPNSVPLWTNLSTIDLQLGNKIKSRSDLDIALLKNPANELLLYHQLLLEVNLATPPQQIQQILTRSLKLQPNSPLLWSFKLRQNTNKSLRKTLYTDALSATDNHPRILLEVGRDFYKDGKLDKAQRWFERAIEGDETFGDSYVWLGLLLKKSNGDFESLKKKVMDVEPNRGEVWISVAKNIQNLNLSAEKVLDIATELIDK